MMKYILILIFTCACIISQAQVNIITTIAGTGIAGYNSDNIPATDAQLNWPCSLAMSKEGNIFIVDPDNVRIRKINASTGVITTIAGYGTAGFSGDGDLATNARFSAPQGIDIDTIGNVYIADGGNHRIRRINVGDGKIVTVAGNGTAGFAGDGGLAVNAEINGPVGVYISREHLYIADYYNNRIRSVNLNTGIIGTIGGSGVAGYSGNGGQATSAQFNGAIDVACDAAGNLFVSDQWNGAVRRIDVITGVITTVAGKGTLGYFGDGGSATSAELNEPGGIFVDKNNNIFIADYRNGAIRKVDGATGIITTVAGGSAGYGGDGGAATNAKLKCVDVYVDENGNIFIADYANDRIRKVSSGVAVTDVDKGVEAKLYPNPTTGVFSVQVPAGISLLTIYNIGGVAVLSQTITTGTAEVDLSGYPSGIYLVYVQSGDKLYVNKVLKN